MPAGNIADLSIALQTTKGTPSVAGQYRTYLTGGGLDPSREVNDVEETGSSRLRSTAFVGQVSVEGEPKIAVRPNAIGLLLYAAMGTKAVSVGTVVVTTSSVANPTVVTTSTAHGLTSGDSTTIAGHSGSTPTINGTHVVTVLSTTTFTIPVNVTVGGTGGTATTGVNTHTFTLANTQPYLTMWRMLGGLLFERFSDCKLTSLTFESDSGGILQATVGVLGLLSEAKVAAEVTVQPEVTEPFLHMDAKGQLMSEGVALSRVSKMTVTIETGVEAAYGNSITADGAEEGMIEATLETEQTIADFALWNRFHYGTASPADNADPTPTVIELGAPGLSIKYSKRSSTGIDAVPNRSLEFTATRVQIAGIGGQAPNTDGSPLTRTVTYRIYQPTAGGSGLTAILKNAISAYVAN